MQPTKILNKTRFEWSLDAVESLKKHDRIETVFDIGCGDELMRNELVGKGLNYQSFDLEPKKDNVREWNVENAFPYDGKADVVLLMEVLEHFNNPWISISNIGKVINKGGYLVLTTPNPEWSDSRLTLLGTGRLTMFTEKDLRVNHHVFTPWFHIVEKLLKDNGFEIVEYASLYGKTKLFEAPLGISLPIRIIYRAFKKIIEIRHKSSIGNTYGIIARKL